MGQIANVEYFYLKCNQILRTNYTASNWGGNNNIKKPINIEWICKATNKVYQDIHKPKTKTTSKHYDCRLKLSTKFNNSTSKIAVDTVLVDIVVNYLSNLNKICDNDCACYVKRDCVCDCYRTHCTCSGTNACTGSYQCNCNCDCECDSNNNCRKPNECGSNTECDCQSYYTVNSITGVCDCNCSRITNCDCACATFTENCGTACDCDCAPVTCVSNTCTYSFSASQGPPGSGWWGSVTVSGSIQSEIDVIPFSGLSVSIPVSLSGSMGTTIPPETASLSISPSSVSYSYNGQYLTSQSVSVSYTTPSVSGGFNVQGYPSKY